MDDRAHYAALEMHSCFHHLTRLCMPSSKVVIVLKRSFAVDIYRGHGVLLRGCQPADGPPQLRDPGGRRAGGPLAQQPPISSQAPMLCRRASWTHSGPKPSTCTTARTTFRSRRIPATSVWSHLDRQWDHRQLGTTHGTGQRAHAKSVRLEKSTGVLAVKAEIPLVRAGAITCRA